MSKISEKQLIESLKQLKEIKPRKEWAVLLRSQIVTEQVQEPVRAESANFISAFSSTFFQKKMAYSFAAVLILAAGVFGLSRLLPAGQLPQKNIASLTQQATLQQNVEALNSKINSLAASSKANKVAINDIDKNVSALAKTLKANPVKDSQTLKSIANSLKTLADVTGKGADFTADPNVQALYQTVVESQIADLQKTTLTQDQQKILAQAQGLYKKGDYSGALEKIWDLSNSPANSSSLINTTTPTNK